jgi:hypothetical protein
MKNVFTIISYYEGVESWVNRCGDFVNGEPSQFNISYHDNIEDASSIFAKYCFENSDGQNICLLNGIDINDYDNIEDIQQKELHENIYYEFDNLSFNKRIQLEQDEAIKIEQEKQRKISEENLKKIRQKQAIEKNEREQLALLMKKYGN